jgi:hypothetical protein
MTLFSLGFAVCELRKALIYKGSWRGSKTPKAGVAGSIPAGAPKCPLFSGGRFVARVQPIPVRNMYENLSCAGSQWRPTVRVREISKIRSGRPRAGRRTPIISTQSDNSLLRVRVSIVFYLVYYRFCYHLASHR